MTTMTRARRFATAAGASVASFAGIVAAVPLVAVVTATPATAAAGRWVVSATGTGSATATCPTGTRLFGLGAEVPGAGYIRKLTPNGALTEATVTANAQVPTTVRAICRPPVAGMVRTSATGQHGTAAASCPTGTALYGLGVGIGQQNSDAYVTRLAPDLDPPTANVAVNAAVPVTAYAICGAPTASVQLAGATETVVGSAKTVTVSCPAGTYVRAPGARVASNTVVLDQVTTNQSLTNATVTAHSAVPGRWVMDAYAICTD